MKEFIKEKLWPFLAGMGSTIIMVLAFFIPSVQDQWDRNESRKIINQYQQLGDDLFDEERYDMAEQAYQRAFELSDSRRLDLEIKRLNAKINRINMDPKWNGTVPEDLEEADFQYVLHLQKEKDQVHERIHTLNSYGIFLSNRKKFKDAEASFKEAIALDSSEEMAYINLGNLYDQIGKKQQALLSYQKAIMLNNNNTRAYYNLGLLYMEMNEWKNAKQQFEAALRIDSSDTDTKQQYELVLKELKN